MKILNIGSGATRTITVNDGNAANDLVITAALTNGTASNLVTTGAGRTVLGGVNTYSGATTVSGGELMFAGAGSSAGSAIAARRNSPDRICRRACQA